MCEIRRLKFPCCRRQKWQYTKLAGSCLSMIPSMRCPPMLCMFIGGDVKDLQEGRCDDCTAERTMIGNRVSFGGGYGGGFRGMVGTGAKREYATGDAGEDDSGVSEQRMAKRVQFDFDPVLLSSTTDESAEHSGSMGGQEVTIVDPESLYELPCTPMSPRTQEEFDNIDWWALDLEFVNQPGKDFPTPAGE